MQPINMIIIYYWDKKTHSQDKVANFTLYQIEKVGMS